MTNVQNQATAVHRQTRGKFILWTVIASVVAAFAAWLSAAMALEVWVIFAGFIAWFTRPTSLTNSLSAMLCLWLGLAIGAASGVLTGALIPSLGHLALPLVVFLVALLIVGLRTQRLTGNMLSWFLGMVTWFAAELDMTAVSFLHLTGATAIGGLAGYTCQALNRRWAE
ncbi:DUF1097 domain-containing protein [Rhizobium ruizarguesonis]|uniref:DUF1097 domain-containing protein n=1 Tax=Rhizobium ruizarguesonis TaxID=2081791 RepID=UPI0010316E3C|nr:DUF1097 domain-containing protein [Rhizobium ruizarguesonis]TAU17160.1 DUF1097 domain-containing protein [Rhizobium ruizarguesonis]TAU57548.1 DUF1097 domain-containing protein [Rhizobium ruizarguesonis]TAV03559.1 DUF1097 domain-containing protein [Rhizobium ruizarguesonis]TAV19699.1 DUF1097 domain-containing protein [Rhizobium ruizarguesonis]TAV20433.1 DUF1097 domain-containing protein [Rhizobium ruizarguesonis]